MTSEEQIEHEKKLAAEAAAQVVQSGMRVGLGTGSTVSYLLPALAARGLELHCVATSPASEAAAIALGLDVRSFEGPDAFPTLDVTIDGADQIDPSGWLIKGGSGAQTRERAVAAAADRFLVIVSSNKLVQQLAPPVPLELAYFGLAATLARLPSARLRDVPRSPDNGVIADFMEPFEDPAETAARLSGTTGVVDHGLFAPDTVAEVFVGRGEDVERLTFR